MCNDSTDEGSEVRELRAVPVRVGVRRLGSGGPSVQVRDESAREVMGQGGLRWRE